MLARVDAASLLEFRKLPRFEQRRVDSVGYFVRNITINQAPARLLGAFRISHDSASRPGYYGYAVSSIGRDERAMDRALDDLDDIRAEDLEAEIRELVPGQAFARFTGNGGVTAGLVERYGSGTRASVFGLEAEARSLDVLHALWCLSWLDDEHETFVAFTDPQDEAVLDTASIGEIHTAYEARNEAGKTRAPSAGGSHAAASTRTAGHSGWTGDRTSGQRETGQTLEEPPPPRLRADDIPAMVELHADAIDRLSRKVADLEREVSSLRSRVYSLSQSSSASSRLETAARFRKPDVPADDGWPTWAWVTLIGTAGVLLVGAVAFGIAAVMRWL